MDTEVRNKIDDLTLGPWSSNPNQFRRRDQRWMVVLEEELGLFESCPNDGASMVIRQGQEQSPAELANRVIACIADCEQAGRTVERTMIRVGACASRESMTARDRIARALISHSAGASNSELVFVVKSGASDQLRTQVLDMAKGLVAVAHDRLRIRLSFGDRPAKPRANAQRGSLDRSLRAVSA